MRASTRAATTATTLNPQPILLKTHTPLPSQTPEFLPVQPTGTETQEPEAQDAATSFSLHQVAETQEPATHSVAETQEPAIAVTQEPLQLKHKNQLLTSFLKYKNQMPRMLQQ
jgi:hypothetical protein